MPVICLARTDISDGSLQVKDLWPNLSQRSDLDPPGQGPVYVNAPDNDVVLYTAAGGARTTSAQYDGVAAYLVDHVEGAAGAALTAGSAGQAAQIATALIAAMRSGAALTLAAVNAIINGVVAGSSLTGGNSTGVLVDLLKVLGGALYRVPAGSSIQDAGGAFVVAQAGSFPAGTYREVLNTDSLAISFAQGDLAGFRSASYSFGGTTGAAVVVYADDGSLYV